VEALRVKGLSKNFGGLQVLQDVTFALNPGERWAIIGPNGAGKTTLMNVLNGVLAPHRGTIELLGQDVTRLSAYERLRLGLARSFQHNSLFPKLTVEENVLLALRGKRDLRGQFLQSMVEGDALYLQMEELLNSVGLWGKRERFVRELSHGEQREMEIAMALASKPKILMLDEPSAGLSGVEATKMVEMIRTMTQEVTLLFTAHDMDVVFSLADQIMVLFFGRIAAQGSGTEIRRDPMVKEIYLGGD
jgi:branched-chain amino acid transport system ATP-binding protein